MISALLFDIANIFLGALLAGVAVGCGFHVLKMIGVSTSSGGERIFFAFAAGAAVMGYAVFCLALARVLYPASLWLLLLVLLPVAVAGWRQAWLSMPLFSEFLPRGWVETCAALLLALFLAAGFLLTLTPETGRDALIYHLALPKLFLEHHGFFFVPGNIYANFPLHSEMLYTLGLFLKGDVVPRLLHFYTLLFTLLGIGEFVRSRMQKNPPIYISMLVFTMIPTVFSVSHMAYIDIFVALYASAAVWSFIRWHEGKGSGWLMMCALFCGTAMACKYTSLFLPLLGCLGILLAYRDGQREGRPLRDLVSFLLVFLLFGSPFYLKSWIVTGNPFYPFFYGIFAGRGWEPRQAELFDGMLMYIGMGRSPLDYLLLPWNLSVHAEMHTERFDGVISPIFLFVLPFAAGIRPLPAWVRTILVSAGLFFLFWASGSQQIRFLSPLFPSLAAVVGFITWRYRSRRLLSGLLLLVIAGCLAYNGMHIYKEFMKIRPVAVVFGRESRSDFIRRQVSSYDIYQYVNANLPSDARLFLVFMKSLTFLCDRNCYSDTMFESYTLQKILSRATSPEDVAQAIQLKGFTHLMYDENYVLGAKSVLTDSEKALFIGYRDRFLKLVHQDRWYFLYRL